AQPRDTANAAATTRTLDVRVKKATLMGEPPCVGCVPDKAEPSRDVGTQERAQAPLDVLIAIHDRSTAFADEVFDLEIDDARLVVGAQTKTAAMADDEIAARDRVADFRRGPAVDVGAVEDGADRVRVVDRRAVLGGDLTVESFPRALSRWSRRH